MLVKDSGIFDTLNLQIKGGIYMFSEPDNDSLANMVKAHPELEPVIQSIIAENKRTTSMFVHELRNPLSLLRGTIQYIEMKHPETAEFKYWNQLQDLVNDMEHMMADASLLNTFHNLKKESTDLIALVNDIKNSFMPQAINQQIDLSTSADPESEPLLHSYNCDSLKLKQVLSNLIKNAFEATKPGNYIRLYLSSFPGKDQALPKLVIKIRNNGLQIPEDEINNIFVPFVTYKKGGTGIGLAVVKKIVDLHYGSVCVVSSEEFTEFTILLPL
jgi:signal transduction histidine kinase